MSWLLHKLCLWWASRKSMCELKKTGDDPRGFQKYFVCEHVGKIMVCSECPNHVVEYEDVGVSLFAIGMYCRIAKMKRLGAFKSEEGGKMWF